MHDRIDDVIVKNDYGGVTTTFHCEESAQDVTAFFKTVALSGMGGALVLSGNSSKWVAHLIGPREI
ncbi:MAG: hypothetical protein GY722_06060 [bacterium]|nr:hypothetical protein [bacterium]